MSLAAVHLCRGSFRRRCTEVYPHPSPGGADARKLSLRPGLHVAEIPLRIIQPVDMVDPKTRQGSFLQEPEDERVGFHEHRLIFHSDCGQIVNVEEPAVVDFFRRDTPVCETVDLLIEKDIEQVKTLWIALSPIEDVNVLLDKLGDCGTVLHDGG